MQKSQERWNRVMGNDCRESKSSSLTLLYERPPLFLTGNLPVPSRLRFLKEKREQGNMHIQETREVVLQLHFQFQQIFGRHFMDETKLKGIVSDQFITPF